MRRMTKLVGILAIVAAMFLIHASAAAGAVVTGSSVVAKPGGSAALSVSINENEGLAGFIIYIECDTDVFRLEEDAESGCYRVEAGEVTKAGALTCTAYGTDGWSVVWYQPQNTFAEGELFTLNLSVAEDAAPGEYPVKISYSPANTIDENGGRVALDTVDGTICVLAKAASFYADGADVSAPGNRYDLTVNMDANPGIAAFLIYIDCDVEAFSLMQMDGGYSVTLGDFANGGTCIANTNADRGFQVIWYSGTEAVKTGVLFTLPLLISDDAALGEYSFDITVSEANLTDASGNIVPTDCVSNSTVTLKQAEITSVAWRKNEESGKDEVTVDLACLQTSEPVVFCVAAYSSNGKMQEIVMREAVGSGSAEQLVFLLTKKMREDFSIRVFILSQPGFTPLAEKWEIPVNTDDVMMEGMGE